MVSCVSDTSTSARCPEPSASPDRRASPDTATPATPASVADVEALLAGYIEDARATSRVARSVESVLERLRAAEKRRALRLGKKRASRILASAVFQGLVGIASAALSGVSAGLGSAATSGSRRIGQAAVKVGAKVLDTAAPPLDPFRIAAGRLETRRDAAAARADEQEGFARSASDHVQAVEAMQRRVVEIMDRCARSAQSAGSVALSSRF